MKLGLKSLVRVKIYRSYKGTIGRIAPDLLKHDFAAQAPNQKWVTDVKEFKVGNEKLYLSPVMDLYNGEIIAYETDKRPVFALVSNMLRKHSPRFKARIPPYCTRIRVGNTNICFESAKCLKACRAREIA